MDLNQDFYQLIKDYETESLKDFDELESESRDLSVTIKNDSKDLFQGLNIGSIMSTISGISSTGGLSLLLSGKSDMLIQNLIANLKPTLVSLQPKVAEIAGDMAKDFIGDFTKRAVTNFINNLGIEDGKKTTARVDQKILKNNITNIAAGNNVKTVKRLKDKFKSKWKEALTSFKNAKDEKEKFTMIEKIKSLLVAGKVGVYLTKVKNDIIKSLADQITSQPNLIRNESEDDVFFFEATIPSLEKYLKDVYVFLEDLEAPERVEWIIYEGTIIGDDNKDAAKLLRYLTNKELKDLSVIYPYKIHNVLKFTRGQKIEALRKYIHRLSDDDKATLVRLVRKYNKIKDSDVDGNQEEQVLKTYINTVKTMFRKVRQN